MVLSKYGVARHIYIPLAKAGSANFAVGADWTPAAGDVKISKDGGAAANVTNLPSAIAMGNGAMWDFSLTATEMQAALVVVIVADAATKAVEDQAIVIETYGHASAQHEFDLDTATQAVTVASGGITAASIATDAIDNDAIAANAVTELQSGLATASALADVQSDTNDIQARLPAALVSGRMDSSVGAMANGTVTAAAIATDAIDADALADGAVTAATFAAGAIDATAIAADAIGSSELAASAVTEIQTGLATSAEVAAVQADTDNIQTRLPAALVGGRMDSSVGAMAAGVVTAAAVATDAIDADALAADAVTEIAAGITVPSAGAVADAVWDEARADHVAAGSFGQGVASVQGNVTGSVASVTGNVGGNVVGNVNGSVASVTGSVASVTGSVGSVAAGGITASSIATDAIDADAVASDAVAEIQNGLATAAAVATVAGFVDTEVGAIKAKTDLLPASPAATSDIPTAAAIADAVLDESLTELVAVPAAAPTLRAAMQWLYQMARNKLTTTATQTKVHTDGGAVAGTASVSDDGTTFERSEFG